MNWTESTDYQQLLTEYQELAQNTKQQQEFQKYLERMWTAPESYTDLLQAYLEFSTPKEPAYQRLNDIKQQKQNTSSSSRRRRRRGGRRRSKRRSKDSSKTSKK